MYLAIEGIKGSGKSTIIGEILGEDSLSEFSSYRITSSMGSRHPMEIAHEKNPLLKNNDEFVEKLFIQRAYWHMPMSKKKMVIGDRSVLTSYVSRWSKWGDPYYTMKKVEKQYKHIMKPDVLIWLESRSERASRNIEGRTPKDIRKIDESIDRLMTDRAIYEELISGNLYKKKVGKIQTIIVPNNGLMEDAKTEIKQIIKFYKK
jgi:thymidylate kinase